MSRLTDPNQVRLTGENSFIALYREEKEPAVARASHWRVLFSPAGPGHALFLKGDLTGDRALVYSDSPALARWLQDEARQLASEKGESVIPATFTRSGDSVSGWTETVRSDVDLVTLIWSELREPFIFRSGPGTRPGIVHGVYSCLIPARRARVTLNGRVASGRPLEQRIDDRVSSSACLALSETWLKPY